MASEKLNWENLLVSVGLRVGDNLIDVLFISLLVWGKIVWPTRLQKPLLGWLVQHLVDPVVLNPLVSRKFFFHEDHWMHLLIQLVTKGAFCLLIEVIALEPERHQIRTISVNFKIFEFFNFSDYLFLCFYFCNLLCFKFYFFGIELPWVPSFGLSGLILLKVLFEQPHLMVVLFINLVQREHLLKKVALVRRLLDQSVIVSLCWHNWNVRHIVAKHFRHEVVHHLSILKSLVQVRVDLLRITNSSNNSSHFNFFVLFIVLISFFNLASVFIP